jgi:hypothetical protein
MNATIRRAHQIRKEAAAVTAAKETIGNKLSTKTVEKERYLKIGTTDEKGRSIVLAVCKGKPPKIRIDGVWATSFSSDFTDFRAVLPGGERYTGRVTDGFVQRRNHALEMSTSRFFDVYGRRLGRSQSEAEEAMSEHIYETTKSAEDDWWRYICDEEGRCVSEFSSSPSGSDWTGDPGYFGKVFYPGTRILWID